MPTSKLIKKPIAHRSKKRSFTTIPPEIRNLIYEYHYDTVQLIELMPKLAPYHVIEAHKVNQKRENSRIDSMPKQGIRCGKPLGKFNRAEGMKTRWHLSVLGGLHLANKQIYGECISFLYTSVRIMAQSPNRLINFLTIIPKKNLKHITRLQLDIQTAGHPCDLKNEVWKKKHDEKWVKMLKIAARKLTGLKDLTINIDVRDIPLRFTLNEAWVRPLLFFTCRKDTLKDIHINVFTPELPNSHVNVGDFNMWTGWQPWYVRMLKERHEGAKEMHRLFGRAIEKRIKGLCEHCSLTEYREALEARFDGEGHQHASNTGAHSGD